MPIRIRKHFAVLSVIGRFNLCPGSGQRGGQSPAAEGAGAGGSHRHRPRLGGRAYRPGMIFIQPLPSETNLNIEHYTVQVG
jgi:hypothetical protein